MSGRDTAVSLTATESIEECNRLLTMTIDGQITDFRNSDPTLGIAFPTGGCC